MGVSQNIFAHIGPEIEEVRRRVTDELRSQGHESLAMVQEELSAFGSSLHSALVILSARLFNYHPRLVIPLACVLQFIYLAARMHFSASERIALQVLVGDFLYSKFFFYLCRYNCLEFLAPLAELICRVHEGRVMRQDRPNWNYPECLEVIDREASLLARGACWAGARVGGAPAEKAEILGEYGFNLGRAWGLVQEKAHPGTWRQFLTRARHNLNSLPALPERETLGKVADAIAVMALGAGGAPAGWGEGLATARRL